MEQESSERGGITYPQWRGSAEKEKPPLARRLGKWLLWSVAVGVALMLLELLAIRVLKL